MKALLLTDKETMELREVDQPAYAADEVLVKVHYCGICGTDVHIFHGEPGSAEVTPPVVLGHEFAGEIMAVGDNVTTLKVGDHVAIDPNIYCGKCDYCRQGRVQLCDNLSAVGVTRNGGMEEYCNVPEGACLVLDKSLPFNAGAMVEPLSCVLHGFNQIGNIQPYTKVLIIGGGFIGSLFLQTVKLENPRQVDVCELNEKKHAMLKDLGADHTYTSTDDISEAYDLVIECVGKKQTSEAAVAMTGKGGEVLLFGVPSPSTTIELPAYQIFNKELKIAGSFINPFTLQQAVLLLNEGKVNVEPLLSHVISLEEVPNVLADYGKLGVTKAIIKISE